MHLSWRYFYRVTPSRQTIIRGFGFGSVPVTALLVYLFQLVLVIFTYLRADSPCDVTFLDLTSLRLLTGSGRVGSRVKNPDTVPSLLRMFTCVYVYRLRRPALQQNLRNSTQSYVRIHTYTCVYVRAHTQCEFGSR